MNLRQLEVFRAVILSGTISGAAHDLHISQPAVSNMIRHIEDRLGLVLFARLKGRLIPTEEARILHREIEPIFLMARSVTQTIQDLKSAAIGSIRIVATPSMGLSYVPRVLCSFLKQRRKVKVSLDIRRLENVIDLIQYNLADFALALSFPEHPTLVGRPIHEGKFVCVMHHDNPLSQLAAISPMDLVEQPFITLERGTPLGNKIEKAFEQSGVEYDWSIETRYCHTACTLASNGVGAAIVDEYTAMAKEFATLCVKPFLPKTPVTVFVIYDGRRPIPTLAKLFIDDLEKLLQSVPTDTSKKANRHH